jgi:hypothetical protein
MARAEAEDRERRERILRSISQRSAAYSANRVKPDPHRQFASVGSSSAGRTNDNSQQQRNSGSPYVSSSGNGGGEQKKQRQQQQPWKGHGWRPSWASSGSGPEQGLEKEKEEAGHIPPPPRAQPQPRRPPAESVSVQQHQQQPPVVYGVDEKFGLAREYQGQPPRTLRRQASLTKRIVDYIRPPKTAVRPVETVVE